MKETLEEASERILANNVDGLKDALQDDDLFYFYKDVIKFYGQEMAKWQQEQSVDLSNVNANNITTASTQNQTLWKEMYSEEDMISFAEFVATYPDKNRNANGEMLHAKSKYDGAERTIDLLKQYKK